MTLWPAFLALLAGGGAPPAAAAGEPAAWHLAVEEDVCSLKRLEGPGEAALQFNRIAGTGRTVVNIRGADWKRLPQRRLKKIAFSLDGGEAVKTERFFIPAGLPNGPVLVMIVDDSGFLDRLAGAETLTVHEAGRPLARFALRSMPEGVAALLACEREQMRRWGIDPEQWFALRVPPKPLVGLVSLVRSSDYPAEAAAGGISGKVIVRLTIAPSGHPVGCDFIARSGSEPLDRTTCAIFLDRARFEPALDAQGKPVAAPYVATISWRTSI
jgi:TonB family protein